MTCLKSLTALLVSTALVTPAFLTPALAAAPPEIKQEAIANVDGQAKQIQVMVDTVFSYAEPGFQEFRTGEYLTGILAKNGFKITRGVAGIPTAWTATWGDGGPLIALGSDEDDLRGVSQIPGDPKIEPIVAGAPGHGEGHNSGMPMIVAAALAIKAEMQKHKIKGRLMLWPGIAEELLGTKAFYVRDGLFKGVDACIFAHVSSDFSTAYGPSSNGMVSVEYTFHGKTAHGAGDPWDGHSALDAAEIMDVAWQFRREHLHLSQRSHNVISDGGGQPNIVPGTAATWYYFREHDFKSLRELWAIGNRIADAAAMATDTTVTSKVLGTAAPNFGNKPLAELLYSNIEMVGMPKWTADDQAFAKLVQEAQGFKIQPLRDKVSPMRPWPPAEERIPTGGGSDDIGDIMWTIPTVTVRYPSNIPGTIGHNVTSAMAMATPIAHKGAVAGAKAVALTVLDLMTTPDILAKAKQYFDTDQQKYDHYDPMLTTNDVPAIHVNDDLMSKMRPLMEPYYYDSAKYGSYLEQLGIQYPKPPVNGIKRPANKPGS
jgi:aminobenzoyl-glutamate utilization protein B